VAVASAGPHASLHLAPDRYHASTTLLSFLQAGCPSCRPTNSVKALKAKRSPRTIKYNRKEEKIKKSMHPVSSLSSIQVDLTIVFKLLNMYKTCATGNLMQETLKIATSPDVETNMNSNIIEKILIKN